MPKSPARKPRPAPQAAPKAPTPEQAAALVHMGGYWDGDSAVALLEQEASRVHNLQTAASYQDLVDLVVGDARRRWGVDVEGPALDRSLAESVATWRARREARAERESADRLRRVRETMTPASAARTWERGPSWWKARCRDRSLPSARKVGAGWVFDVADATALARERGISKLTGIDGH